MAERSEIYGPDVRRERPLRADRQLRGGSALPDGGEIAQVRADLDRARSQVLDAVESLEQSLRRVVDWRARVRARPAAFLAGAFCIGYLAGRFA